MVCVMRSRFCVFRTGLLVCQQVDRYTYRFQIEWKVGRSYGGMAGCARAMQGGLPCREVSMKKTVEVFRLGVASSCSRGIRRPPLSRFKWASFLNTGSPTRPYDVARKLRAQARCLLQRRFVTPIGLRCTFVTYSDYICLNTWPVYSFKHDFLFTTNNTRKMQYPRRGEVQWDSVSPQGGWHRLSQAELHLKHLLSPRRNVSILTALICIDQQQRPSRGGLMAAPCLIRSIRA